MPLNDILTALIRAESALTETPAMYAANEGETRRDAIAAVRAAIAELEKQLAPDFCRDPKRCVNKGYCPREIACNH